LGASNRWLTRKRSTLKVPTPKGTLISVAVGLSWSDLCNGIGSVRREPLGWPSLDAVRELSVLKRAHSHNTRSFLLTRRRQTAVDTAQAFYVCGARQIAPRAYTLSPVDSRPPRTGQRRAPHISPRAARLAGGVCIMAHARRSGAPFVGRSSIWAGAHDRVHLSCAAVCQAVCHLKDV
jgi:hypothetical protein